MVFTMIFAKKKYLCRLLKTQERMSSSSSTLTGVEFIPKSDTGTSQAPDKFNIFKTELASICGDESWPKHLEHMKALPDVSFHLYEITSGKEADKEHKNSFWILLVNSQVAMYFDICTKDKKTKPDVNTIDAILTVISELREKNLHKEYYFRKDKTRYTYLTLGSSNFDKVLVDETEIEKAKVKMPKQAGGAAFIRLPNIKKKPPASPILSTAEPAKTIPIPMPSPFLCCRNIEQREIVQMIQKKSAMLTPDNYGTELSQSITVLGNNTSEDEQLKIINFQIRQMQLDIVSALPDILSRIAVTVRQEEQKAKEMADAADKAAKEKAAADKAAKERAAALRQEEFAKAAAAAEKAAKERADAIAKASGQKESSPTAELANPKDQSPGLFERTKQLYHSTVDTLAAPFRKTSEGIEEPDPFPDTDPNKTETAAPSVAVTPGGATITDISPMMFPAYKLIMSDMEEKAKHFGYKCYKSNCVLQHLNNMGIVPLLQAKGLPLIPPYAQALPWGCGKGHNKKNCLYWLLANQTATTNPFLVANVMSLNQYYQQSGQKHASNLLRTFFGSGRR